MWKQEDSMKEKTKQHKCIQICDFQINLKSM